MRKKLLSIVLIAALSLSMVACSGEETIETSDTNSEFATEDSPADIYEPATIVGVWGTCTIQLSKAYVGDAATSQLQSMGEDVENYTPIEEDGRIVLFEYHVSADEGFDENPFLGSDIFGNDIWDVDMESKYEYSVFDLYENASLDYYQLELTTGEDSEMYMVMELPNDVDQFVASFSGEDREYWFLYDLTK